MFLFEWEGGGGPPLGMGGSPYAAWGDSPYSFWEN